MSKTINLILATFFYAIICALLLRSPDRGVKPVPRELYEGLISGTHQGYTDPGNKFSAFKKYFISNTPVTFLMDTPFTPYAPGIEHYYTAQSYFVPMILNPEPDEKIALIYCSNHTIADLRLQQTGYRLAAVEGDGKGIGVKVR